MYVSECVNFNNNQLRETESSIEPARAMEREQPGPAVGVAADGLAADVDRRHRRAARLERYRRPQRLAPRAEGLQVNIQN